MSVIYRQYDSRWGGLSYPAGCTFAGSGCGPTSCANVIANVSNSSVTPKDTRAYMLKHNYAVAHRGTAWSGIPACLKNWGYTVKECPSMSDVWKECEAGHKQGVILFRAGSKGGVTWTTGGHFVAFTDYKKENGKHYLYTRDSSSRKNDGWHCYETTMQGLIPAIWTCYYPKKTTSTTTKTKKGYTGAFPTGTVKKGSKGENVKRVQRFLNWYWGKSVLVVDGSCGPKTVEKIKAFQKNYKSLVVDGSCGPKTIAVMKAVKK